MSERRRVFEFAAVSTPSTSAFNRWPYPHYRPSHVRLCPNREAAGRHRQGDRGIHPAAQGGGAELHGAVPVSQGKVALVQRARGAAVLSTASAARLRAMCSRLWARSRTWAFPKRCGWWRRSAEFRCRSGSSRRRKRRPSARLRAKLLELHEIATAWFEEQLRVPEGAVAREYLAGRGLSAEGISEIQDRLRAG